MVNIVWLRNELRLQDNPLLHSAAAEDTAVLPVFIWSDSGNRVGSASRWWLHHSLDALSKDIAALGTTLLLRKGSPATVLTQLAAAYEAVTVFWNRAGDPTGREQDDAVEKALHQAGIAVRVFTAANQLINPALVLNKAGGPFKVFTPFWKHASALTTAAPLSAPQSLRSPATTVSGLSLDSLGLLPKKNWAHGLETTWRPGEKGAHDRLDHFLADSLRHYQHARDIPGQEGTSKLSPHLCFGEISPKIIVQAIQNRCAENPRIATADSAAFIRQLYWREFAQYLLHHFPFMVDKPMYPAFERFPWRDDSTQLRAWQQGLTGYPIVDAGMRELWATGWMHNRVRMLAGSFLVKDLLLPWQAGADWFRDTLVDADEANNTLGWQWVGGCGPDAAPYFRVFNPVLQGERFDPDGVYTRRWVPEIKGLPNQYLHAPWTAPVSELQSAEIVLGETYPRPLVDHHDARDRALAAYASVKTSK